MHHLLGTEEDLGENEAGQGKNGQAWYYGGDWSEKDPLTRNQLLGDQNEGMRRYKQRTVHCGRRKE